MWGLCFWKVSKLPLQTVMGAECISSGSACDGARIAGCGGGYLWRPGRPAGSVISPSVLWL